MAETESDKAALLVDVENLFYHQSRRERALARDCLAALLWWSRRAVSPARLILREGYAKPHDPSARALRGSARGVGFHLRPVPEGKDLAELQVMLRLDELAEARYRAFVLGGADSKMIRHVRDLRAASGIDSWLVLPTSYPRRERAKFEPGERYGSIEPKAVVWIDEVLRTHLQAQRVSATPPQGEEQSLSPFVASGGFWRALNPGTLPIEDHTWRDVATERLTAAGFTPECSTELAAVLQQRLQVDPCARAIGTAPDKRVWAKLCLTLLLRAYVEAEQPNDALAQFHQAAIHIGSAYIRKAIVRAACE